MYLRKNQIDESLINQVRVKLNIDLRKKVNHSLLIKLVHLVWIPVQKQTDIHNLQNLTNKL